MMRPPPRFTLFPYPPLFGSGRGGGGAARGGGAGAVFATPAGIATIRHLSVEGGYAHVSDGSAVASGALALRAGRLSWGFGAAARDTAGGPGGAPGPPGLSLLAVCTSPFAVGTSVQYVGETLAGPPQGAWAGGGRV